MATQPAPKARRKVPVRKLVTLAVVLAILAGILAFGGRWLVHASRPRHPDAVLVLSGFKHGERAAAAAKLFERTGASRLVIFTAGESDVGKPKAASFLVSKGVPRDRIRVVG